MVCTGEPSPNSHSVLSAFACVSVEENVTLSAIGIGSTSMPPDFAVGTVAEPFGQPVPPGPNPMIFGEPAVRCIAYTVCSVLPAATTPADPASSLIEHAGGSAACVFPPVQPISWNVGLSTSTPPCRNPPSLARAMRAWM